MTAQADLHEPWRPPLLTIGELPRRGRVISAEMAVPDVERLFMDDPRLSSVVVAGAELACITRSWFFDQLIGPLGYGRGLYSRQRIAVLTPEHSLTLPEGTTIVDATASVLERPELHRYDDIVVQFADGSCSTVHVAELFAELAHAQAYEGLHDGLTGLPNRRLFFDRLSALHARAAQDRTQGFAVLFVDIDDFKTINDGLGHVTGDRALVEVGRRLAGLTYPILTVARLGGDEFGVLVDCARPDVAIEEIAESLAALMRGPVEVDGERVALSASVGVAVGDDGATPDELMRSADLAMYAVKHRHKGRYAFYEGSMHTRVRERFELRSLLEGALERDEFRLVYQPVVEPETGAIAGAEVLLRWERPGEGLIAPARFIPTCEQTGLIVEVGRWVLEETCRRAVAWAAEHPEHPPLPLSVNLSPRQLQEPDFVDQVEQILADTGMRPSALVLEITEGLLIENFPDAVDRLKRLKALGLRIALDDFGTGFSSLGYLDRLPIDIVKLDRTFVKRLHSSSDTGLLRGIVALARTLGLMVVAEGVETAEQLEALRAASCERAQGYYFSRPIPPADFIALLGDGPEARRLPVRDGEPLESLALAAG